VSVVTSLLLLLEIDWALARFSILQVASQMNLAGLAFVTRETDSLASGSCTRLTFIIRANYMWQIQGLSSV